MIEPYYEHAGITIYLGNSQDILPQLAGWAAGRRVYPRRERLVQEVLPLGKIA